jgi:hypothetical protein
MTNFFAALPDYRPVTVSPVKLDDFEIVVQFHKTFAGASKGARVF